MPFAWSVRSLHPRDCPRGVERSDRRALTALGADQCRGRQQGIVNAVCLPVSEIVCVGVGCRDQNGFDFVEMIAGDWLHGPTRLSAGPYYNDDRDGSRQAGVERPKLARVPWTDRIVRFWHGLRATAACELRLWSPVIWQSFHSRGLDAPARAQEDLRCRTCYVIGAPSRCEIKC